jgi:hypothetical protein
MATREKGIQKLAVGLLGSHIALLLIVCLGVDCPALGAVPSGLTLPNRSARYLSAAELTRFSSANLKNSDWRVGSLRQCLDAPRAARAANGVNLSRKSDDLFALGRKIRDPVSFRIPTKLLHEKTIGQIRGQSFAKYSGFDEYWQAAGTGTRGKFFESQSVLQANSALKTRGSDYRYAITAVEGDPGHAADLVLLNKNKKIVSRYQLKSTRNVDDIVKFSQEAKYADMRIVTHPETVAQVRDRLARELRRANRRGKPLPSNWQTVRDKLANGLITDSLVEGKSVSSYATTSENTRRFRFAQWRKGPAIKPRVGKLAAKTAIKPIVIPRVASKTGIVVARVAKGSLIVLEVVAAPVDIGFAAYGYYDTFSRYGNGALDHDLFATKLAIHTTEAALGAAAAYSLGVGLGLFAAPEPIVTKVTGIVVVVGSVVVIATDMVVSSVVSDRDHARQQTLEALTSSERRLAIQADLLERLRATSEN